MAPALVGAALTGATSVRRVLNRRSRRPSWFVNIRRGRADEKRVTSEISPCATSRRAIQRHDCAELAAARGGGGDRVEERRAHGACSSSTRSPAAVVPPGRGDHRPQRGRVAALGEQRRRADEQLARRAPRRLGRASPASTPASISASATRNRYAGPVPDRPVTASSWRLGRRARRCRRRRGSPRPSRGRRRVAVAPARSPRRPGRRAPACSASPARRRRPSPAAASQRGER